MSPEDEGGGRVLEALNDALDGKTLHTRAQYGETFPQRFVMAYRLRSSHYDISGFLSDEANEVWHASLTEGHRNFFPPLIQDIAQEVSRLWTVAPLWQPGVLPAEAISTSAHAELCRLFPVHFRAQSSNTIGQSHRLPQRNDLQTLLDFPVDQCPAWG